MVSRSRTLEAPPATFCRLANLSLKKCECMGHDEISHLIRFHRFKAAFFYLYRLASEATPEDHTADRVAIFILCRPDHTGEHKRNIRQ